MALSNGPTLNFGAGSMANVFCSESQQGANTFAALVTGVPGAGSYNLVVHHNQTLTACP